MVGSRGGGDGQEHRFDDIAGQTDAALTLGLLHRHCGLLLGR